MKKEFYKLSILILLVSLLFVSLLYLPTLFKKKGYYGQNFLVPTSGTSKVLQDVYGLQEAFIRVAEQLKPSVVHIKTIYTYQVPEIEFFFGDPFEDFFEEFFDIPRRREPKRRYRQYKTEGGGSGVIIHPDGYILTNEHVIKDATEIKVVININGKEKEYKGRIVGKDPRTDLAVIKIDGKNLPFAKLGDSDKIRIGQWVIAIGAPFGLEQTVTAGIVSAVRQRIVVEGREYRDFIQTDAAINRGNSGGPLCNLDGEVIGINTAIYAPTGGFIGIGFAIPINRAKEILDDLIHKGKVVRGWLGVEIRPVDSVIARQFGLKEETGVLVNNVLKDTPAEKSGLKRGDIILEVITKDKTIKISSPLELQDTISSLKPKEKIKLKIFRDKKEMIIPVELAEMPQDLSKLEPSEEEIEEEAEEKKFVWLGYTFTNLTDYYRNKLNIDQSIEGVVVIKIDYRDKNYEDVGLRENDVIVSINQQKINDIVTLKKVLNNVNLKEGVVFDIIRDGRPIYISYSKQ